MDLLFHDVYIKSIVNSFTPWRTPPGNELQALLSSQSEFTVPISRFSNILKIKLPKNANKTKTLGTYLNTLLANSTKSPANKNALKKNIGYYLAIIEYIPENMTWGRNAKQMANLKAAGAKKI